MVVVLYIVDMRYTKNLVAFGAFVHSFLLAARVLAKLFVFIGLYLLLYNEIFLVCKFFFHQFNCCGLIIIVRRVHSLNYAVFISNSGPDFALKTRLLNAHHRTSLGHHICRLLIELHVRRTDDQIVRDLIWVLRWSAFTTKFIRWNSFCTAFNTKLVVWLVDEWCFSIFSLLH